MGYSSPCLYCGSSDSLVRFDFALMRVDDTSRNWGETAISAVVGAVTFPLLGAALIRLPGKKIQGEALHMRLVVCRNCRKKEANLFGIFLLNEFRAAKHPNWNELREIGFSTFLDFEKMSMEFKLKYQTTL